MPPDASSGSTLALAQPEKWLAPDAPFAPWGNGTALLAQYMDMLLKWNKVLNLSGAHDAVRLLRDLVQDSFFLARFLDMLPLPSDTILYDLGAGAGLPGIPLRIFWRRGKYTLVERNSKRSIFLQNLLAGLKLPNTEAHMADVETYLARRHRSAHAIISRAFKPWPHLLPLCAPALAPGGMLVIMANEAPSESLPAPWRIERSFCYQISPGKSRWLWATAPGDASH